MHIVLLLLMLLLLACVVAMCCWRVLLVIYAVLFSGFVHVFLNEIENVCALFFGAAHNEMLKLENAILTLVWRYTIWRGSLTIQWRYF